jgi:benzoylformate decarboxylase
MSGRNAFPEDHPLFAGFLPPMREEIVRLLGGHDLILGLGAHLFNYHVEGTGPTAPADARLFNLLDDPQLASSFPVGTAIICSIGEAVRELLSAPSPQLRQLPEPRRKLEPLSGEKLTDAYLLQEISALRPKGSVIVEEAPSSRTAMHQRLPITEEDGFYTCASGGLGHGLPAAVGVALGTPGRKVIAIIGDGSSMYSIQALWSASQLNLPITFVVVNNQSYEALNGFAARFGLEKAVGTDLPGIDFEGLAEAQGVRAVTVRTSWDLGPALKNAFVAPYPTLVNVMVELS